MKEFTDITILLDRSGSMFSIKEAMETAIDSFIKEHRVNPTTKVSLVQFDGDNDQEIVYQSVPVSAVEKFTLVPRGNTPLLDALCKVIDRTGERLASMKESDRPDQVLMVIITDGQENASQRYSRHDVKNRITRQRNDYKWQFVYLGANQDAFTEAASFGIPSNWALTYDASQKGVLGATRALNVNTVSYTTSVDRSAPVRDFDEDQRKQAKDTL